MSIIDDLLSTRKMYMELGFDTLPLHPGMKPPIPHEWQRMEPETMWQKAPYDANIGIRAGGDYGIAIIDCDEKNKPGTFEKVIGWLASLNYLPGDYPVVQTASTIGRHIYIELSGEMSGNVRILSKAFGAGELRYGPGAYVVAPPSQINEGSNYSLVQGDFRQLPRIQIIDLFPIIASKEIRNSTKSNNFEVSRLAKDLLDGRNVGRYHSRSEAEFALILSLINYGYKFDRILFLFNNNPCAGKYHEKRKRSERIAFQYLQSSYQNALEYSISHESHGRLLGKSAIGWAESHPWFGRTSLCDRAILIAHATIIQNSGQITYAASSRQLGELSGYSHRTASVSTQRLCDMNLIRKVNQNVANNATKYTLGAKLLHSLNTYCEEVGKFGTKSSNSRRI